MTTVKRTGEHTTLQDRPPIACNISSGIMVLTRSAEHGNKQYKIAPIPEAAKIYADGVASEATWDEIKAALKAAAPNFKKSPLQPANTLYFVFDQARCNIPGIASMVLDKYGEIREDGVKRVYSFPVVFFGADKESISRQGFDAWKMGKHHRWSRVLADGDRHCLSFEELKPDPKARRKRWGGRKKTDLGICDPNRCDLFLDGGCVHSIELYFRIPGIPTGSMFFALKTNSIMSLLELSGDPEDPESMGILDYAKRDFGRIHGLFHGKPLFALTKSIDDVSRTDWKTGTQHKERKEIIHLVTTGVDTVALLAQQEAAPNAELTQANAARLEGPDTEHTATTARPPEASEPSPDSAEATDAPEDVKAFRVHLSKVIGAFDPPWTGDDLEEWMVGRGYDKGDVHTVAGLNSIISVLERVQDAVREKHAAAEQEQPPTDGEPVDGEPF